jgi:hypothetical protein
MLRSFFNFDQYITTMAISVNEIEFHEHLEEGYCS